MDEAVQGLLGNRTAGRRLVAQATFLSQHAIGPKSRARRLGVQRVG
jgi:hypothetical protein